MKIAGLDLSLSLRRSFKYRLIAAFCILSITPVILVQTTSYYNLARILQKNIDTLEQSNLVQTRKIIRTKLDFYEDLLYQLYTDDHIIELIAKIDAGENAEFNSYLLRRALHAYVYTMPYIQSLTVMTGGGNLVFDDLLTGYNTVASWLDVTGEQPSQIYDSVISGNETVVMSSKLASYFSARQYYLFHLAHRIIDYKDIRKKNGVVILSIDEKMLGEICNEVLESKTSPGADNMVFILDRLGTIISYPDETKIGSKLDLPSDAAGRTAAIRNLVWGEGAAGRKNLAVYEIEESGTGWSIVLARDERVVYGEISDQLKLMVLVALLSVAALLWIILYITARLTRSIDSVVAAMNTAGEGEFSVRIRKDRKMPLEMEKIADNFNHMIARIDELLHEVQTASDNQKNAEIAALEAQVNPHFLYNTLDTINWMAIDRDEFEISAAIGALAHILRYGIDNSNGVVEIRQEIEWLKNYLALQQTRLKNSFEYVMDIESATLDCRIHKLLFQPFVENSIIHAFKGVEGKHLLHISIAQKNERILVTIADNGPGIGAQAVAALNEGRPQEDEGRGHVGMRNAIERIKMYYGDSSSVFVESPTGGGTRIHIQLPAVREGVVPS